MVKINLSKYRDISSDNKSEVYLDLKELLGKGRRHNLYLEFKDGTYFTESDKGQIYTSLKIVVPQVIDYLLGRGVSEGINLDDLYQVCRLDGWGKGVPADISILRNLILFLTGETVKVRRQHSPDEFYQGFDSGLDVSRSFIEIWNNNIDDSNLNHLSELSGESFDNSMELEISKGKQGVADTREQPLNLIVEGVAGSGKSHMLQELRESGEYGENGRQIEVVVFHPSTSYEEFVSGIRPNFTKKEGEGEFVTQEGTFVQMCNRAAANPDKKFLLFIDEINRANTSRVFGDLMLVIEDSKRVDFSKFTTKSPKDENFETENKPKVNSLGADESADGQVAKSEKYPLKDYQYGALFSSETTIPSTEDGKSAEYVRLQTPIIKQGIEFSKLAVPSNLHVMGTMNTTDRSVGTIDLALRRRFHWITQEPMSDKKELIDALELSGDKDKSVDLVAGWFMDANTVLKTEVGPDARLGHAYFFGKDGDAKAIAEALITQLLEIIYTFNIKEDVLEKIGLPKLKAYNDKKLDYEGKGLGRRPIVKEDKGKSPTADGGSDSENEVSDNTDSENSQGDQ